MTSLTRCTWVWVSSGSWRWTGRLSVLQFMGSQRVRHDWATELNWTEQECVCYKWLHMTGPHKASSGAQGTPHWWYPWTDPMVWAQCPAALWEPPGRPLHIGTSSLHTLLNSQVGGRERVEKAYHLQSLGCCLSLCVWFRASNLTLCVSSSSVIQGWCWSQLPTPCCLEGHVKWGNDNALLTAKYLMVLNITISWVLKTTFLPTLKSPRWLIWCGYELQGKKLALFWEFSPNSPYSLSKEWQATGVIVSHLLLWIAMRKPPWEKNKSKI